MYSCPTIPSVPNFRESTSKETVCQVILCSDNGLTNYDRVRRKHLLYIDLNFSLVKTRRYTTVERSLIKYKIKIRDM